MQQETCNGTRKHSICSRGCSFNLIRLQCCSTRFPLLLSVRVDPLPHTDCFLTNLSMLYAVVLMVWSRGIQLNTQVYFWQLFFVFSNLLYYPISIFCRRAQKRGGTRLKDTHPVFYAQHRNRK